MRKLLAISPLVLASLVSGTANAQVAVEDQITVPLEVFLDIDPANALSAGADLSFDLSDLPAGLSPESTREIAAGAPDGLDQLTIAFPGDELGVNPNDLVIQINLDTVLNDVIVEGASVTDALTPGMATDQVDLFGEISISAINDALSAIPADVLASEDFSLDLSPFLSGAVSGDGSNAVLAE